MSDIIDFNELRNKVKDKDVDKFEEYIYSLYSSLSQGQITMGDLNKKLIEYMETNNISQEKFFNIQKKLLDRYGYDINSLNDQMKNLGFDFNPSTLKPQEDYEAMRKTISFQEKYKSRISNKSVTFYSISNSINDIKLYLSAEEVIITSAKKIDLKDQELNEFLVSYKKLREGQSLKILLCEDSSEYEY